MRVKGLSLTCMTVIVGSLLLTVSASVEAGASEELAGTIEAANAKFMAKFATGKGAGLAELYTEDGMLLPPNSDFVSGRSAIGEFWQGAMDAGVTGAKLQTVEVTGMGETACEVGRYSLLNAEGNVIDQGKYVVLWKKQGGGWKLHRDIWNASVPSPGGGGEE